VTTSLQNRTAPPSWRGLFGCPGVESYSCILLATRNGNQQEANVAPVCCCHQGKRVADYASPHDPVWIRSLASQR
jgi:hypothetical protein